MQQKKAAFGAEVRFEDDGPTASITDIGGDVTIDETAGLQDDAVPTNPDRGAVSDPDNDDVLGTATLNTVALSTVFGANVVNQGTDGSDFEQYALSATALVSITGSDAGADFEGATTVISLAVANATSDLQTSDGKNIVLFKEGDLIVGGRE